MRRADPLVILLILSAWVTAQQTGGPDRDYTINGVGSSLASHVPSTVAVPGVMANRYTTQESDMPVLWSTATSGVTGWFLTPTNSVDIGPGGLADLGNGADPSNPLAPFFRTAPDGSFSITLPAPASLAGSSLYFAMAHASVTSPDAFFVSQTHLVTFALDPNLSPGIANCTPGGSTQTLGDDSNVNVSLGFPFPYYGVAYTDVWIGSNGFLTFGQGDTDFSETVGELLNGPPRIAMWWDDLNPSNGAQGTISFFTNVASIAEVCFAGVPEYPNTGSNDFKATLTTGGFFSLDYGPMSSLDAIVGVSPGNGLDPVGLAVNLSVGPNLIPSGMACYEQFVGTNDLSGYQVNFLTDSGGTPTTQL